MLRLMVILTGRPVRAMPMPLNCQPPRKKSGDRGLLVKESMAAAYGQLPERAAAEVLTHVLVAGGVLADVAVDVLGDVCFAATQAAIIERMGEFVVD